MGEAAIALQITPKEAETAILRTWLDHGCWRSWGDGGWRYTPRGVHLVED